MNEQKLKGLIKDLLEPVYDDLVTCVFDMYKDILSNLSSTMPEDQLVDFVKPLIEAQAASLRQSFKSIDISKLAQQVKEKQNGRES